MAHSLVPVDSIYREHKPLGNSFFRDHDFQWSKDSKALYLVKDVFYEPEMSQLFSKKGELWKFSLETASLDPVIKPFAAYSYFFGNGLTIYYSTPTVKGDLQLMRFDGTTSSVVDYRDGKDVSSVELSKAPPEMVFASFDSFDIDNTLAYTKGLGFSVEGDRQIQEVTVRNEPILKLTRGEGFKGPYYCSQVSGNAVLPGDRYLLLKLSCKNYRGQLLIDGTSGVYQRLPADTRVFSTMNTETYPRYRITSGGLLANK